MTPASRKRIFAELCDAALPFAARTRPTVGGASRTSAFAAALRVRISTPSSLSPYCWIAAGATRAPRSRYVVSRGLAGFCAWTSVPATSTPATATSAVAESATCTVDRMFNGSVLDRRRGWGKIWTRGVHTTRRKRGIERPKKLVKRSNSSMSRRGPGNAKAGSNTGSKGSQGNKTAAGKPSESESHNVLSRISHIHRPTKDAMLAAATGFFQRLRIRTKWSLIRQMRPYNWEDISAFFSWLFIGHVIWVVVGTTTFMSLAILVVNSVFAQETLAGAVGNYLTRETGVKVVFESAIVPKWKDGCISFKNVFVSRRPGQQKNDKRNVRKGSPTTAAAAAAAAKQAGEESGREAVEAEAVQEEDTNYTQFDLTIDTVNVTLSFARWMNGKGLLTDVEIKGVRGVIDRTHVHWVGDVDPRSQRREHHPGDFEIESFKMEDLLVTIHQPGGFRPFSVSIYNCDLPQLRKQWLFYDFLCANNMSGSYDDSLFTIHPRQTQTNFTSEMVNGNAVDTSPSPWKKTGRLRIDGLNIDHLNRGVEGPFSWIQSGNVDIIADVMFPADEDLQLSEVVRDIVERMEATVSQRVSYAPSHSATEKTTAERERDNKFVIMDLHVQLNDPRAAVPLFTSDLSYVNNALIRPIVAYINSRKTYIPINCRVIKRLDEFDGSWTTFDSGLMDDLSAETYDAFAKDVTDDQARRRRIKKVGLWSLQLAMQAILMAMAGSVA